MRNHRCAPLDWGKNSMKEERRLSAFHIHHAFYKPLYKTWEAYAKEKQAEPADLYGL